MTITGKKINELTLSTILTNDTVFPLVIVQDGVAESIAKKVSISQLANFLGDIGGGGGSIPISYYYEAPTWTISLDKKTLTILDTSNANTVWVFKNGLKLRSDTDDISEDNDYFLEGAILKFNTPLEDTDVINLEVF